MGEKVPGFAVGFVVVVAGVASGAGRAVGIEAEPHFGSGEKNFGAGDEIPGVHRKNVNGEEVEVFCAVTLFAGAAVAEAAEISSASAASGEALDLYAKHASAVLDDDVIVERVAPGLEDAISAEGGGGHELQLDPLASLLE